MEKVLLGRATNLLKLAKRRNDLLRETENSVRKYEKEKEESQKFIKIVQNYVAERNDPIMQAYSLLLTSTVQSNLESSGKEMEQQIKKNKLAAELTCRMEDIKEELLNLLNPSSIEKMKTEEIPKEKLRELVVIILLLNYDNYTITEANLFESVADFHEMLKQSNDPILKKLVSGGTITNNVIDFFLEKI